MLINVFLFSSFTPCKNVGKRIKNKNKDYLVSTTPSLPIWIGLYELILQII